MRGWTLVLMAVAVSACRRPNPAYVVRGDAGSTPDLAADRHTDAMSVDRPPTPDVMPDVARDLPRDTRPDVVEAGRMTSAALAVNLIGYWRFDEAAGAMMAADSSGSGNHGILEGLDPSSAWVPGLYGRALEWPDREKFLQGVKVPQSASINGIASAFTIAAWAWRPAPVANRYYSILSRQYAMEFTDAYNLTFHGTLLEAYIFANGVHTLLAGTGYPVPAASWVHVACVYDGSNARLFLDGRQIGMKALQGTITQDVENPIYIGVNVNTVWPPESYTGKLDDVMLWNRALPLDQIGMLARGVAPAGP